MEHRVAQKGFDTLINATSSRYVLSRVVGQRAAQLKRGVPSTVTGKIVPRDQNAVSAAMEEVERGSGVVWGDDVPSAVDIMRAVEADERARREETPVFSILQDAPGGGDARTAWERARTSRNDPFK